MVSGVDSSGALSPSRSQCAAGCGVRERNGRLWLWHFRRGLTPLYPVEGDLFVTAYQRPCFIRCLRDEAGTVRGLSLSGNRVQELELNKV